MRNRKSPLQDLMPKSGMQYRSGDSILQRPYFDFQIYNAWSKAAGSTSIFKNLAKGCHVVDKVLANMIKIARRPSINKHLRSSLSGDGFFRFAMAVRKETAWATKTNIYVFMELLYQLFYAHQMSVHNEHGENGKADDYSLTAKEISEFLAEHHVDWDMAAQEYENYLLMKTCVYSYKKASTTRDPFINCRTCTNI